MSLPKGLHGIAFRAGFPLDQQGTAAEGRSPCLHMTEKKPQRDEDFYSRRLFVIGVIVCVVLALGSLYLFLALRDRAQLEDCFMQGRSNCLPLDPTPAGK